MLVVSSEKGKPDSLRRRGVRVRLFAESVLRRTSWVGAERMKGERLEDRRRCRCQENVKLMRAWPWIWTVAVV